MIWKAACHSFGGQHADSLWTQHMGFSQACYVRPVLQIVQFVVIYSLQVVHKQVSFATAVQQHLQSTTTDKLCLSFCL